MMTTRLLYLENVNITSCTAKVVSVIGTDDKRLGLVLDQTCFYPGEKGRNCDIGHIIYGEDDFVVDEVRMDENGVVYHFGTTEGTFHEGIEVECIVDKLCRERNEAQRSAGQNGVI